MSTQDSTYTKDIWQRFAQIMVTKCNLRQVCDILCVDETGISLISL